MYHRIVSDEQPVDDADERPWSVTLDDFVWQMDRIRQTGRVGVSMREVHTALTSGGVVPAEWVAITFDDGNASDHAHASPVLSARGFRATFFVCGNRIDSGGGLSPAMIRHLVATGMHIGSHAMTHRFLPSLTANEERGELLESRRALEAIVEGTVDHFAPPGGRWSARTARTLRDLSYRAVSTSVFGYNGSNRPRFAYRRIPIVRATTRDHFDTILRGDRRRLLRGYARSMALSAVRGALGEATYSKLRAVRPGGES
jgi:peptidoglycan/xylan/chitin deacetylase (PgdA/CDA1 family)